MCSKGSRVRDGAFGVVAFQAGLQPLPPEAVQRSFEEASTPPPWEGFLASISAGVNEEVLFRLGLMSLFVFWERSSCGRKSGLPPGWSGRRWCSPRERALRRRHRDTRHSAGYQLDVAAN